MNFPARAIGIIIDEGSIILRMAYRVGDYIDDYCSRCKFSSDHSVVSLVGEEVKRVLCRTCNTEHKYRGNKGSKEMTAKDAWDKLFASVSGPASASAAEPAKKKSRSKK